MDQDESFRSEARRRFGTDGIFEDPVVEEQVAANDRGLWLPRSIEFRPKAGQWYAFPYHTLMHVSFVPNSQIELRFSTHTVTIAGRNLSQIYENVREQRCSSVAESERADALAREQRGVVESVAVRELGRKARGEVIPQSDSPST